jgi:hypothetical protein
MSLFMPKLLLIVGTILVTQQSIAGTLSPGDLERMRAKADETRLLCNNKIHFDTYSFESCVNKLAQQYKGDDQNRLAVSYAGFAISLSNTRTGMTGAEDTAKHFYWLYRPLQEKLGIDDMTLCSLIPTDCKIRGAETRAIAKQARPQKSPASSKQVDSHGH